MKVYILTWEEAWNNYAPTPHKRLYFTEKGPRTHINTMMRREAGWNGIMKHINIELKELDAVPRKLKI